MSRAFKRVSVAQKNSLGMLVDVRARPEKLGRSLARLALPTAYFCNSFQGSAWNALLRGSCLSWNLAATLLILPGARMIHESRF